MPNTIYNFLTVVLKLCNIIWRLDITKNFKLESESRPGMRADISFPARSFQLQSQKLLRTIFGKTTSHCETS